MDTFFVSACGMFVMGLLQGLLTTPSWQRFSLLACGWALASGQHTMPTYRWLTGATRVKPFSSFSVFLGGPLYKARWKLGACLLQRAATWGAAGEPIVLEGDDSTQNKAGRHSEGAAPYRNGAGTARQAYRSLWGLNFVWVIMRMPLACWPGHWRSVPVGFSLYLKEPQATRLQLPSRSRSALAREIIACVANPLSGRALRGLADGGYATKECLRDLPTNVAVVSRLLVTGNLYALPTSPRPSQRGRRPRTGQLLGSPQTLARKRLGWQDHPTEVGAKVQAWQGLWHAVLPGRQLRIVGLRRPATKRTKKTTQRKPPPRVEACFTTDLSLTPPAILQQYRARWALEITSRDRYGCDGLGQAQCRKVTRILGATTLRRVMAAARTLWFGEQAEQCYGSELRRDRPWYRHTVAPSQLDLIWACREALQKDGICPIPRFSPDLAKNHQEPEHAFPIAA